MSQKSWKSKNKNKSEKQQPYWARKQESFDNVDIGQRIQCRECRVPCFRARFSQRPLQVYREAVAWQMRGGPPAELPRCIGCTPQAAAELRCNGCRNTLPLGSFSGRQRQNPDGAHCINCVQEMEDRLPGLDDQLIEEEMIQENRARDAATSNATSVVNSFTGSRSHTQPPSATFDGIYMDERDSAWAGGSVRSPSPTNTEVSVQRSTSSYSGAGPGSNAFARQGAWVAPATARVQTRLAREDRREAEAQGANNREDSDDEDWEM
ncbi:hypothetical protein H2200_010134 [Cladophialophora chaetospira]|uniref:Stc1 domain-containing protein n=1 Tax=Cladophialophora chaetospira TaxID=386627 RepID=A0AA38X2I4_9EURO|nr:hypothetical protein H2200_010134 [Cladophialophora chaetospira]